MTNYFLITAQDREIPGGARAAINEIHAKIRDAGAEILMVGLKGNAPMIEFSSSQDRREVYPASYEDDLMLRRRCELGLFYKSDVRGPVLDFV